MRLIRFLILGILFGIIMTKSEAISWFRIQEMFQFQAFHMYGIICTAVAIGVVGIWLMKRMKLKSIDGEALRLEPKQIQVKRLLFGGFLFGLGWAMTGACPGPLYVLLGHGLWIILVIVASALLGAFFYGLLKEKLPH